LSGFCSILDSWLCPASILFKQLHYSVRYYIIHSMCCINFFQSSPSFCLFHSYSLRTRPHNRQLPDRLSRLVDCNFIIMYAIYQSYRHLSAFIMFTVNDANLCFCVLMLCTFYFIVVTAVCQLLINGYVMYQHQLECRPMPDVMAALPNIGGALCSTQQSLAHTHY